MARHRLSFVFSGRPISSRAVEINFLPQQNRARCGPSPRRVEPGGIFPGIRNRRSASPRGELALCVSNQFLANAFSSGRFCHDEQTQTPQEAGIAGADKPDDVAPRVPDNGALDGLGTPFGVPEPGNRN